MKVQISDLVVRTREVELPDQCPKCGDPVDAARAEVTLDWNYGGGTLLGVTYPDGTPVPPVGYACLGCGHLIAWSHQAVIDSPAPEVEQTTVWSRGLDRLMKSPRVLKTQT